MDIVTTAFDYNSKRSTDDPYTDFADKVSTKYMVVFLVVAAFLVGTEQFLGRNIECWVSSQFTRQSDYVSFFYDYCWLTNTRRLNSSDNISDFEQGKIVVYYQWVGFILIALIGFYVAPTFILKTIIHNFDISLVKLSQIANTFNVSSDNQGRTKCVNSLTSSIVNYVAHSRNDKFTKSYIFIKFLFVVFNLAAIVFLASIFGSGYYFFGIRFLSKLLKSKEITSEIFPLETACEVTLFTQNREGSNKELVECILVTNIFSIFIFVFLNLLQWGVLITSFISFLTWCLRMTIYSRVEFIEQYLYGTSDDFDVMSIIEMLKLDGIFILQLLSSNASDLAVASTVKNLCLVNERTRFDYQKDPETDVEVNYQ